MSLLPYATEGGIGLPVSIPIDQKVSTLSISTLTTDKIVGKTLTVSTISTNTLSANSTFTGFIETPYGESSNWYVDNTLYVNFQQLTADEDQLFLNGIPIATTANLSSIQDWSIYAQISTLDGNGQNIKGTNLLQANTIGVSTMGVCNLTGVQGAFTNLFTQNLMAANIVNFTSTVIEVYESTVRSDIKLANISTLNAGTLSCGSISTNTFAANVGFFSTLTAASINVSTIIAPVNPNLAVSSLTTETLNVTNSGTFANGGTFNGTRPNFTTGINTNGPNNFNYQSLDNIRVVTGSNIDMFAVDPTGFGGESMTLGADGGTYTAFYPTTNIISRYGGGGQINITAERPSLLVAVPSQNVNITAKGGVGYYTGIPVGGGINISAEAGGANLFTTTGVLANGAIRQTAYTFFNGIYTVPGFAARSAGSTAEYSGLTSPTLPIYGCSFYSALISLSLTAGVTPASASYPGVVYLRGDNGTKVVNGFYADTINNNVGYDLNIQSLTTPLLDVSNRNINLNSFNNINLNTQNGGQVYINGTPYSGGGSIPQNLVVSSLKAVSTNISTLTVSSINGLPYSAGGWVGTAASDLNMNGYDIKSPLVLQLSTQYLYLFGSTITAMVATNSIVQGYQNIFNYTSNFNVSSGTTKIESQSNITINSKDSIFISSQKQHITVASYGMILSADNGANEINMGSAVNDMYITANSGMNLQIANGPLNIDPKSIAINAFSGSAVMNASGDITLSNTGAYGSANIRFNSANNADITALNTVQINAVNQSITLDSAATITGTAGTTASLSANAGAQDLTLDAPNSYFRNTNGNINITTSGSINQTATNSWIATSISNTSLNCSSNVLITSSNGTVAVNTPNGLVLTSQTFKRALGTASLGQPVFQQGVASGSGANGNVSVTIPSGYTSIGSYQAFVSHQGTTPANTSVFRNASNAFTIYWTNAGGGTQDFDWMTAGN